MKWTVPRIFYGKKAYFYHIWITYFLLLSLCIQFNEKWNEENDKTKLRIMKKKRDVVFVETQKKFVNSGDFADCLFSFLRVFFAGCNNFFSGLGLYHMIVG